MPDQPTPRIVDYFGVYAPARFPRSRTKRSALRLAAKFRLPLIRAGHNLLIDEIAGDVALAEFAIHRKQPPRRGRPRKAI